jgi:Fe-S cluster biogenesis protein NfuA/nitrite reductase/ring-hydroxylating ferredoxin subunit
VGDLSAVGERIEVLLESSSSAGVVHRERAEELVGLVTDLYGRGIERIFEILHERGQLGDDTLAALTADELVSSLLVVHDLHPYSVEQRVEDALEKVRPYLGSHGGNVELLGIDELGVVQLRLLGSCDGCPSSSVTLQLAVEGAIEAAAPEIAGIEVETPLPDTVARHSLISVDALRSRLDKRPGPADVEWVGVAELADLAPGQLVGLSLSGLNVFGCRDGADVFVYCDVCPACAGSFAGAAMREAVPGVPAVRCPTCARDYDIRRAGAEAHGGHGHLDPLPTLLGPDGWQVAVPMTVMA